MSSSEAYRGGCRIVVKAGKAPFIRRNRHPWIYQQTVAEIQGNPEDSNLAAVVAHDGSHLGWGFFSPRSLIAVRMVSFDEQMPADGWIEDRIRSACQLRRSVPLDTDSMRLVNSEGDHVPGLVADLLGDTVVLTLHVKGMEILVDRVADCMRELFPGLRVFLKRDPHYAAIEGLSRPDGYLRGEGDGTSVVREGNVRFSVDYAQGQKTGFYLDQRENRRICAACSQGRSVLNLFSYSGAFGLLAAAAGARAVVSVESSRKAVELSQRNVELNPGIPSGSLQWVREDVFRFLDNPGRYDVAVADPPPFARKRSEVQGAIRGYTRLFQSVIQCLSPGGLAFLFSCSGAIDRLAFRRIVSEASTRSGRRTRLLRELHADVDHPVAPSHPEGEYLKGWLLNAE